MDGGSGNSRIQPRREDASHHIRRTRQPTQERIMNLRDTVARRDARRAPSVCAASSGVLGCTEGILIAGTDGIPPPIEGIAGNIGALLGAGNTGGPPIAGTLKVGRARVSGGKRASAI